MAKCHEQNTRPFGISFLALDLITCIPPAHAVVVNGVPPIGAVLVTGVPPQYANSIIRVFGIDLRGDSFY